MSREHPATSRQVETKLASRHIQFEFEPNLQIDVIRDVEGNQVRLGAHRAPKEMVDRYAEQMKAGAIFPAIVVNDRYELIDGNTRTAAARRNGKTTIATYVCANLSSLEARSLSVDLNQSHGLSMTTEELRTFVVGAVEEGQVLDANALARMTGVKASTLARWVAAKHFETRASREEIVPERFADLSDSSRAALQAAKLRSVFADATALAIDAKVPSTELKSIVAEANAASSEVEAQAVVTRAREARVDDIRAYASGFKGARRGGTSAALHIGGLLRFEVTDLLDVPPDRQGETFKRMSLLRRRLEEALTRARTEWQLADGLTEGN
ncbi:MAG: ParB N-terminal domain-containing protein [Solirubrobacteraceae bacterium]|nr:ParB N-terminal domain-containing protein [Solirubrobacteraceae bacterium]